MPKTECKCYLHYIEMVSKLHGDAKSQAIERNSIIHSIIELHAINVSNPFVGNQKT